MRRVISDAAIIADAKAATADLAAAVSKAGYSKTGAPRGDPRGHPQRRKWRFSASSRRWLT